MKIHSTRNALAALVIGASLSGFLSLPLAAHAQAAASKAAPTVAPTPAAVTPEARTAIKELLDVMNTRDNLGKTFQAMGQTLPPQMAQAMNRQIEASALTPEQKQKVREGMNQPFDTAVKEAQQIIVSPKLIDDTIDKMYAIYAKYYTVAEIRQLVAFYKSPLGAKTLTAMPQAINESLQAGVSNFQPRINALIDKTVKTQIDSVAKK